MFFTTLATCHRTNYSNTTRRIDTIRLVAGDIRTSACVSSTMTDAEQRTTAAERNRAARGIETVVKVLVLARD